MVSNLCQKPYVYCNDNTVHAADADDDDDGDDDDDDGGDYDDYDGGDDETNHLVSSQIIYHVR